MKILLSSYACAPGYGSELGQGWNWAVELAKLGHEVVVLTCSRNKSRIGDAADKYGLRIVYHEVLPQINELPLLGFQIHYILWQYLAANIAVRITKAERFDLIHHITWTAFRYPSFMGRAAIPFVFGPIGGGEDTPPCLRKGLGFTGRMFDSLRRLSTFFARMDPSVLQTFRRATLLFATTDETRRCIPERFQNKTRVRLAVGITPRASSTQSRTYHSSNAFKLLYAGRLLQWKGLHLAIKALSKVRDPEVTMSIVGRGPDLDRLKKLAAKLQVGDRIDFVSWVKHEALMEMYSSYHLFLFPSLHDSGANAVLEAMISGLPVLCLDCGAPGVMVDPSCGEVIDASTAESEEDVVERMAAFIVKMKGDPAFAQDLSMGAVKRAAHYSWTNSIQRVYSDIETFLDLPSDAKASVEATALDAKAR